MTTSIIWFKTNLRLHDNETLIRAIEMSDVVIPVYCFDEDHFNTTQFGFNKTGSFRIKFLLEALTDLDKNLRTVGSGLIALKGKPEVILPSLALYYNANKIFSQTEFCFEELKTLASVREALTKVHCDLVTVGNNEMFHVDDLPFQVEVIPDIFTNFRKQTEKESKVRAAFDNPTFIKSPELPPLQLPSLCDLSNEAVIEDCRMAFKFNGGESTALQRLNFYLFESGFVAHYKQTRNEMIGENYSTKFSPWLALGCLSARKIYHEIKKFEDEIVANDSTYWVIFELLWRDYFRFMMMKYGNKIFLPNGIKSKLSGIVNDNQEKNLNDWISCNTGVDFVDANMIELRLTGFMSNRGRQNVASYLCNDLKVHWRLGAAYFEQQLIDYDVCSNWGNWAYIAGVGNDPRENRYFNIEKQAAVYDSNKSFRNLWLQKV